PRHEHRLEVGRGDVEADLRAEHPVEHDALEVPLVQDELDVPAGDGRRIEGGQAHTSLSADWHVLRKSPARRAVPDTGANTAERGKRSSTMVRKNKTIVALLAG